jgi:integrase
MAKKYDPMRGVRLHGRTFELRLTVDGKRHTYDLGTDDPVKAAAEADKIRLNPDQYKEIKAWDEQIASYIARRLNRKTFTAKSASETERVLRKFRDHIGGESAATVTGKDLQDWYDLLEKKNAEGSARTYAARVEAFLRWLSRQQKTRFMPEFKLEFIRPDPENVKVGDAVPPAGVANLLAKCPRKDLKFVLFAGFQEGMRKNEIINATPDWFDLKTATITIPASQTVDGVRFIRKNRKKSVLPLMPQFKAFLTKEFVGWKKQSFMLHPKVKVTTRKGNPRVYRWDPRTPFEKHVTNCKLAWVGMHIMRHTFITLCLEAGYTLEQVSEWTGDTIKTLQKHYSHVKPRSDTLHTDPFRVPAKGKGKKPRA